MKNNITFFVLAIALLMGGCQDEPQTKNKTIETNSMTTKTTLKDELNVRRTEFNKIASDEKKKGYAEGIETVAKSGVLENAMQVGDKAPDFSLSNAKGETVILSDYLAKGPVVLTWYRGGWCPYCNITLNRLQKELPNFQAMGANLFALSPELPDSSISTAEKNELEFEVLSDIGNNVARDYGIVFKLTNYVANAYQKGFDLHKYNGDESDELPLSATYVIAQDGTIKYAFLDADYRNRAEPEAIIQALRELQ